MTKLGLRRLDIFFPGVVSGLMILDTFEQRKDDLSKTSARKVSLGSRVKQCELLDAPTQK